MKSFFFVCVCFFLVFFGCFCLFLCFFVFVFVCFFWGGLFWFVQKG